MTVDLLTAGTYLLLLLVIFYYIQAIMPSWVSWICIVAILALFLWWMFSGNTNKVQESVEDDELNQSESPTPESPKQQFRVQDDYQEEKKDFALIDEIEDNNDQMNYLHFKRIYLTPEFLKKFTEAQQEAMKITKRKLLQVRRDTIKNFKALQDSIFDNKGTQDKHSISTISRIDSLLSDIKARTINVETSRQNLINALTDTENGIDSLIGRDDVKNFLALQLYTFSRNPKIFFRNFQNIALYGQAGVGKTKLAKVIGYVYAMSGIIVRNDVLITTKKSFTTPYVNQSASKTVKVLLSYLGGIVFIDEAYDLAPPSDPFGLSRDHGHEAITEMVNFIDKMIGLSIIIVAGYKDEMENRFMTANQGLPRRFPHIITLESYSPKDLTTILICHLHETCPEIKITEQHGNYIYTVVKYVCLNYPDMFKNQGGDMQNLSGSISRAVYGTVGKEWDTNAEEIIFNGFNEYLKSKGHSLEQLDC